MDVPREIDHDRRRFLAGATMTITGAILGAFGKAHANARGPHEFEAIAGATEWLNSPALTQENLAGKVVVVDFCTYTCINWLRTLPYRRAWAKKYRQGFVLIGVHTPEFSFEHDPDNVRRALRQMKVEYPIVIDNDYAIWRAFKNNYWPALYFVDARGRVVDHHYGESDYEQSEKRIQRLLGEAGVAQSVEGGVSYAANGVEAAADWSSLRSPENYLGHEKTERFSSVGGTVDDRPHVYVAPQRLPLNEWALMGEWTLGREASVLSKPGGRIAYRFHARDVNLVMGAARGGSPVHFRVSLDGKPPGAAHGIEVDEAGNGTVSEPRLYQLIRQPKGFGDRVFEIEFRDAGVGAFSFTFG
jgi:thiol-disulfide isomerase/thioredoxin